MDYVRDSQLGHLVRAITRNKVLLWPEELPGFQFQPIIEASTSEKVNEREASDANDPEIGKVQNTGAQNDNDNDDDQQDQLPIERVATRVGTSQADAEINLAKLGTNAADVILMDWYGEEDVDNPLNWPMRKKLFTTFVICLYTFVVYCGSAIFVPSFGFLMYRFDVSEVVSSLGLALYVVGYAMGPMIFSPLSEIAMIGRNPPYVISFILFFVVSIITAVVDNFAALMVLRFLQGFFGSPCLASGGASLQDIYSWSQVPYGFIVWVAAMYCGPALGPLLSGYAVSSNWHWPLWEMVIMAGPFMILLIAFLPETSRSTILLHRAQRIRNVTGNPNIRAASEIKKIKMADIVVDALIKPTEIAIKDPAITFVCIYSALVYAIYYSFFEAFPIVYHGFYGMTLGEIGLIFLSIIIGCLIATAMYAAYLYFIFMPRSQKVAPTQESRLLPALIAVWVLPAGLFLFAWTSRESIHWIAPTIGVSIYAGSSFIIFQCIIAYVPLTYPDYVASLFAANDFIRSMTAAGFVMFSRSMYVNLGIGKGVSLLAGLSVMGIIGMYFLFYFGATLRARSKFAAS
ncbi:hypothetical protein EG329_011829 [Mollisiaceae sp. DMI_Dod_QoI]|nr:hypothetical protein EG329_011829 [Helotiales sp. DMI_Dod_QoI]